MISADRECNLVSIILPSYNSSNYIQTTIKSVLDQTHTQLELIIIDDASTDNSPALISEIAEVDRRIKLILIDENSGGPAKPRNIGLSHVNGAYVAFVDADDIWHPNKLSVQLEAMERYGLDLCSARVKKFVDEKQVSFDDVGCNCYDRITINTLLKKNILAASSVILKKEVAESLKFSELERHHAVEDYIAWLEIHKRQSIQSARLNEKLVMYRVRNDSISRSKLKMANKIFSVLREFEISGKRLGWRKYYYFCTYLIGAIKSEMYT